MPVPIKIDRAGGRPRQMRREVVGPVRCERCFHPVRPPVAPSSVQLAEAAARFGEIESTAAADILTASRKHAAKALRVARTDGLLERTRVALPTGGFGYHYRPTAAAAAYVLSGSLARRLQTLATLAPSARLG